jgi:uncharacterized membrane protein YccC
MKLRRVRDWLQGWSGELRLVLRTTLAGLITFSLAYLLELPQAIWAVLTSVLIMQASVGGLLKASLDRMLGTVAGAIWGVSVTLAIPHRDTLALGLPLAVALAPMALLAALKPNYRVAPVTAVIVLLSTTGTELGPIHYAVDRVLEIGLGCLVGFAVSLLVLPARAHGLLTEAAAEVILALRDLLDILLQDMTRSADGTALAAIHLRLNQALSRVEGFVADVKRERANRLTDAPDAEPVARNLRRLYHDLTAIGRTVIEPLPQPARQYLAEATGDLRLVILDYLAGSAASAGGRLAPPSLDSVDKALLAFRDSMDRLRQSGTLRELDIEELERVLSLAFALQQLRGNLGDLADRIAEHAKSVSPAIRSGTSLEPTGSPVGFAATGKGMDNP